MHDAQIDRVTVADELTHKLAAALQPHDALLDALGFHDDIVITQQIGCRLDQLFYRNKGVSVVQIKAHGIQDTCVAAFGGQSGNIQMGGQLVSHVKLDAVILITQHIRVFAQCVDCCHAQTLIEQRRERDRQTVFGQKVHQQAHFAHFGELLTDVSCLACGDAANLGQALGFVLQHVEGLRAEGLGDAHGELGADAADESRAEILCHAAGGLGQAALEAVRLELLAIRRMGDPGAVTDQLLAQSEIGDDACHRDLLAVPGEQAQDDIAVFSILKHDLCDRAINCLLFLHVVGFLSNPVRTAFRNRRNPRMWCRYPPR